MPFYNTTTLVQRVIVRLNQVAGAGTQLYSEDTIKQFLQEVYYMVRSKRMWDHLMVWETKLLDGSTGKVTVPFTGSTGFEDVDMVLYSTQSRPMPQLSRGINPFRLTGTVPRYLEPLHSSDDPSSQYLFRVWPLASIADSGKPLYVHRRKDPDNLFTDASVVVPFDDTCLVTGAAARYAADDGANLANAQALQAVFDTRLKQVTQQHDDAVIVLDPRSNQIGLNEWIEDPR